VPLRKSVASLWEQCPLVFWCPESQEQTKEKFEKQSSSHRLSRQEPGAQVGSSVRPQVRGSVAGDSAVPEECRRRMALEDRVASRRCLERSRRVRCDEAAQGRSHLCRRDAGKQHLRQRIRQRQEQDHRAAQGLASEGGFHPQAQSHQEGSGARQRAARRATGGGPLLTELTRRGLGFSEAPFSFCTRCLIVIDGAQTFPRRSKLPNKKRKATRTRVVRKYHRY
jgi:hypothetical protein